MKKLFSIFILSLFVTTINAQDMTAVEEEEPSFSLSGSVDAYYRVNLSAPTDPTYTDGVVAPGSSFANLPGFSLGMINLIAAYEGEKSGFVADMVYGPRGSDAVFNSPMYSATGNIINQLYVYWAASDALTLTFGNFNTFLGYEVISPAANYNYSTSYMFSWGPFSHTGLKANLDLGGGLSAMLAVMNPTDFTEFNPVNTYTLGAQLGYTNDMGGAWLNFVLGDQDGSLNEDASGVGDASAGTLFQVDLTTGWDLSDQLYVGFNGTFNSVAAGEVVNPSGDIEDADGDPSTFLGAALYAQYALSDAFSLGIRGEYFAEGNGGAGAIGAYDDNRDASIIDLTLSANYSVGNLTFIPEIRLDNASEDAFISNTWDEDLGGYEASSSLTSFVLAAVYSF